MENKLKERIKVCSIIMKEAKGKVQLLLEEALNEISIKSKWRIFTEHIKLLNEAGMNIELLVDSDFNNCTEQTVKFFEFNLETKEDAAEYYKKEKTLFINAKEYDLASKARNMEESIKNVSSYSPIKIRRKVSYEIIDPQLKIKVHSNFGEVFHHIKESVNHSLEE